MEFTDKCNTCGHDFWQHHKLNVQGSNCSECECTKFEFIPLTLEQQKEAAAFYAGANYIFARLGNWYGRDIHFYREYFNDCAARGINPNLVSMIAEEAYHVSMDYGRGWRDDPNIKTEPYIKKEEKEALDK